MDVIREDILRVKISRGGVFEEEPTFAVSADLNAAPPAFSVEEGGQSVKVRTERMALTLWLDPFRIDVHRTDGSVIFETQQDEDGRYLAYATLNDAFVVARKCRPEDAFFGLGEKTGPLNRKGRDFTLWNNDVLDPNSAALFTAGKPKDDPRSDRMSTEFDPYYVSSPSSII